MNGTNISLTASEISDIIVSRFVEQIKNPEMKLRPIYIVGHAGVGKSQIVRQASVKAQEQIRKLLGDKNLVTECKTNALVFTEPPEFMGLCHITVDAKDNEEMTIFARPSLIPKNGYGILFFDEANRANKEIKSGLLTLIEDREINGHKLGAGWIVVLAGNPAGDRYQGATDFDPALLDRVNPVWFRGEPKETVKYLKGKYGEHPLVNFLEENHDFIDFEAKTRNTPRGLEYAIRATKDFPDDSWVRSNKQLLNTMGCELGLESTSYIMGRIVLKVKDLTVEEVLNNKEKTVEFLKKHRDNTDLIGTIEKRVREHIEKTLKSYSRAKELEGVPLFPESETENLIAFMENLPPEHFLTTLRAIDDDGTLDYNLEYVFGTTFTKKSEKLKKFVVDLYESGQKGDEAKK